MKVLAINGSPNKNGNTGTALEMMADELKREHIECEIVHIGRKHMHGCIGCGHCFSSEGNLCVFHDDPLNEILPAMRAADGIILGSPTYYGSIAGAMKCFCDRAFFSSHGPGYFRNKVGAAVVSVRRAGGVDVYNQLNNYFNLLEMITPPSQYWVVGYGMSPGEITQDGEGVQVVRRNANAMAWLLKMRDATKNSVALPRMEDKVNTNFIR